MAADICNLQNAGVETIIEIRCEVGNFVGEIDELCLKWWPKIEEVFGEFGMRSARVIAGMLDDAFAKAKGEVEPAKGRIALFKPGDDAKGM